MDEKHVILIVDDTPENLQVLGNLLEQQGYEVLVATNGADALENAMSIPMPDLILLDVMMPDMNGYEVCTRLKGAESTKDIPIIFVTAMSDDSNEETGLAMGAVDYIRKPFKLPLVMARVRNQLELQLHRNHLAELVKERTTELAALNAELEQRIAEEVEKNIQKDHLMFQQARLTAMGEMLSCIAHQWRQPLNNIGLNIQCFQLDYDDGKLDRSQFTAFVEGNMNILSHLSHTIDDFRTFFIQEKTCTTFEPFKAIEKSVALVRTAFESMGIAITLVDHGAPPVMGCGNEFSQVVLNIISNARDVLLERYIPDPVIEICCYRENNYSCVSVRDNGGGIPTEILEKIFDPYFTTKFQSQGTGIGLYMVKMIIEKHMGGSCTARNTADGAEFIIRIPAHVV